MNEKNNLKKEWDPILEIYLTIEIKALRKILNRTLYQELALFKTQNELEILQNEK